MTGKDLDEALSSLAELNHVQAFDAASRIVTTRAQSVRRAFVLEVGSAIIALIATVVAVRGAGRFARHGRVLMEGENERAGELDLLAQRVAHDLMSPLAAVALSLGTVARAHPDELTVRAVDRANRALERSRRMVRGIYEFSRAGAQPVPGAAAPLRAAALDTLDELLAVEAQSPPTVDMEGFEEVRVAMAPAVLGVVLGNLLSNAFKFAREAPVRRVKLRATADHEVVHVEIEDTGPGVSPGLEDAIFEPYRRGPVATQPGLGLGLATVKRLVIAHGGRLGVRNAPSGGAVFWFNLPRALETRLEETHEPSPARAGPSEAHPLH